MELFKIPNKFERKKEKRVIAKQRWEKWKTSKMVDVTVAPLMIT